MNYPTKIDEITTYQYRESATIKKACIVPIRRHPKDQSEHGVFIGLNLPERTFKGELLGCFLQYDDDDERS